MPTQNASGTCVLLTILLAAGCVPNLDPGPVAADLAADPPRVITLPAVRGESLVVHAATSTGSVHDRPGFEGLAALVTHSMADDLAADIAKVGGSLAVRVGRDAAEITLECPVPRAEACLDAWERAWSTPLSQDRWDAARDRAREALDALTADPSRAGQAMLDALLFEGHRYAHPSLGRVGVLPVLDVDQGVRFRQSHWVRQAVVASVAGAWSEHHVTRVARSLGVLTARIPPTATRFSARSRTGRELVVVPGAGLPWVHLGHALPREATAAERFHLALGASIVSEWSAGMHVVDGWDRDHPSLAFEVVPGDDSAVDATAAALAALERLRGGIEAGELSRLRVEMGRLLDRIEQTPVEAARSAAMHELTSRPSVSDRRAWLDAATPEAVNRALATHLRPDDVKMVARTSEPESFEEAAEALHIAEIWEISPTAWLR